MVDIYVDGYPVLFNKNKIMFATLTSSSSLSNLGSNNSNKNGTRKKTTTLLQYCTRTSGVTMTMLTMNATKIIIIITALTTIIIDELGWQQRWQK